MFLFAATFSEEFQRYFAGGMMEHADWNFRTERAQMDE